MEGLSEKGGEREIMDTDNRVVIANWGLRRGGGEYRGNKRRMET